MAAQIKNVQDARGLAALLGVSYGKSLSFVLHRVPDAQRYKTLSIAKKNGQGTRIIHRPIRPLRDIQRRLLPYLTALYDAPPCVHGNVKGRSIKTNATPHVAKRYVVNLDLQDFFPTIHFKRIVGILTSSRYGLPTATAKVIAQLACHNGRLPPGAPTSGVISNIVCGPLDSKLLRIAKASRLHYTRYADDITFSGNSPASIREALGISLDGAFVARDPNALSEEFRSLILGEGFQINGLKVWIVTKQARQQVTGIIVNRKLNVKSKYFRNLRAAIHAAERYGIAAAEAEYRSRTSKPDASLKEFIRGKLAFLGQITSFNKRYTTLANRFITLYPGEKIHTPLNERDNATYQLTLPISKNVGTAIHIGSGYFLTAAHIFDGDDPQLGALVKVPGLFASTHVTTVNIDKTIDIALLRAAASVGKEGRPSISLATRRLRGGDTLEGFGYPNYTEGDTLSRVQTRLTARRKIFGCTRVVVDMPWPKGMSGGPVFAADGVFVGMIFSGPFEGEHEGVVSTSFTPTELFAPTLEKWLSTASPAT